MCWLLQYHTEYFILKNKQNKTKTTKTLFHLFNLNPFLWVSGNQFCFYNVFILSKIFYNCNHTACRPFGPFVFLLLRVASVFWIQILSEINVLLRLWSSSKVTGELWIIMYVLKEILRILKKINGQFFNHCNLLILTKMCEKNMLKV